jgi:septal ring factor EnvC (AmiA/AmiB activator)
VVWAATPISAGAQSQDPKSLDRAAAKDQDIARDLALKAAALKQEIRDLQVKMVGAARKAQEQEAALTAVEATLQDLEVQEAAAAENLAGRRAQLNLTLAALQRIALTPTEAVLVSPAAPIDIVRSATLLKVAVPAIEARAAALRGELAALDQLRGRIAVERGALTETAKLLKEERRQTAALIERKKQLQAATAAEQDAAVKRAERLAGQAANLRELMDRVERDAMARAERERAARAQREEERLALERQAEAYAEAQRQANAQASAEAQAPSAEAAADETQFQIAALQPSANIRAFPSEQHSLVLPALGKVITQYGELSTASVDGGAASKGITIRTREGAQVVAPYDGKIVYAGKFRSYGQILIIEHGEQYHTLLAGLDRIDAAVGQWVLAGEPLALMSSSRDQSPELYLELRRTGQPINPLPWLAINGEKVRG